LAISPPSDIVLDVLKAADPTRADAVAQRLGALGASAPSEPDAFTKALDSTSPAKAIATWSAAQSARTRLTNSAQAATDKESHAKVEFEATLLNGLVKEMLPKDAPEVYGEGTAGDIWKSMLADQMSHQIARSGKLGIASRLFATHPLSHHGAADAKSLVGHSALDVAQASANPLSMSSAADISNGAVLFANRKRT
jgi:Rod binding domain-containing protein